MALCSEVGEANTELTTGMLRDGQLQHMIVEVDQAHLRLSGTEIDSLNNGVFPASSLQGLLSTPLYDALLAPVEEQKSIMALCGDEVTADHTWANDQRSLLIAASPELPYATLQTIFYTAGQAEFGRIYVVVNVPEGPRYSAPAYAPDAQRITVTFADNEARTLSKGVGHASTPVSDGALSAHYATVEIDPDALACGKVEPRATTTWSAVVNTIAELTQDGAQAVVLAADDDVKAIQPEPSPPAAPLAQVFADSVPVLVISIPKVSLNTLAAPNVAGECDSLIDLTETRISAGNRDNELAQGTSGIAGVFELVENQGSGLGIDNSNEGLTEDSPELSQGINRVSVQDRTIDGPLGPEVLDGAIRSHNDAILACHESADAGTITVRMIIDSSGSVTSATPTASHINNDAVSLCVAETLKELQLPRLPGSLTATVSITLAFETE